MIFSSLPSPSPSTTNKMLFLYFPSQWMTPPNRKLGLTHHIQTSTTFCVFLLFNVFQWCSLTSNWFCISSFYCFLIWINASVFFALLKSAINFPAIHSINICEYLPYVRNSAEDKTRNKQTQSLSSWNGHLSHVPFLKSKCYTPHLQTKWFLCHLLCVLRQANDLAF